MTPGTRTIHRFSSRSSAATRVQVVGTTRRWVQTSSFPDPDRPRQLARELVWAHWMALGRPTLETAKRYAETLKSATEHPDLAVRVMDETARIAVTATGLLAECRKAAHEDAMEDVFRQVEDAQEEGG